MMTISRILILLTYTFIIHLPLIAQQDSAAFKPFRQWVVGIGAAYIEDVDNNDETNLYQEWTVLNSISTEVSKKLRVGVDYRTILTNDPILGKDNYFILGNFAQYNFLPQQRGRFFIEAAIRYGNYCTCGDTDPYKVNNLWYIGWGFGGSIFLLQNLYLDLAFTSNIITNSIKDKYSFNHYTLGLEYKFDLSKNKIIKI